MLTNVGSCERRKILRAITSYRTWGSFAVLGRYQQDYRTFRKANARGPHLMRVRYSSLVCEQNAAVALFRRFVIHVSRYWICHLEKVSLGLRNCVRETATRLTETVPDAASKSSLWLRLEGSF